MPVDNEPRTAEEEAFMLELPPLPDDQPSSSSTQAAVLVRLVLDYLEQAQEAEDDEVFERTTPAQRLLDFQTYMSNLDLDEDEIARITG